MWLPKPPIGSRYNRDHSITRGLRACLPLNDGSYDLGSGPGVRTCQIYGDKITPSGTVVDSDTVWRNSLVGPALQVSVPSTGGLNLHVLKEFNLLTEMSVAALIRLDSLPSSIGGFEQYVVGDWDDGHTFRVFLRGGKSHFQVRTDTSNSSVSLDVPDSVVLLHDYWIIVGGVWGNNVIRAFYNDAPLSSLFGNVFGTTLDRIGNVRVGAYVNNANLRFPGQIGGLWLWDRPLTDEERHILFRDPFLMFGSDRLRVTPSGPPPATGRLNVLSGDLGIHSGVRSVR